MKLYFTIKSVIPKTDLKGWLDSVDPIFKKRREKWLEESIYVEYEELMDDFKAFLECKEPVIDSKGNQLTPYDIYNVTDSFVLRIQKLIQILELKLYTTFNVNKETGVRYVVLRVNWLDHKGKPFRYFSHNLGAEHKIAVNGKIPQRLIDDSRDYFQKTMWDQYLIDCGVDDITGYDIHGNQVIVDD